MLFLVLISVYCPLSVFAQDVIETDNENDSAVFAPGVGETMVEQGIRSEKAWRTTGSSYTVSGEELERMNVGNLLNTLQGRIPGLTVMTGSGEPGYDNPVMLARGKSSWNLNGNNLLVMLDGFQVDLGVLSSLSVFEIESVTYLRDAGSLAIYGLMGGSGALVIKTRRGEVMSGTEISVNGRFGVQALTDMPTVLNAYDYTRLYNQARENDGLTVRYANPELYKDGGSLTHPDVDWYNEVLKPNASIQEYNLSFRGGGEKARYYVLLDYTNFTGNYKEADEIDKDFGTNAEFNKFNLRSNVDVDITSNFSINAQISGVIEDRNTPAGFTAASLFNNLMKLPAAAFPVKNPDGSWGNSSVYDFNPVMLLKTGGIYNGHTRTVQTNIGFKEKLDMFTPGLSFNGALSFSNRYVGYTNKTFSVLSYELLKDSEDNPILDTDGAYTYAELGTIADDISDGLNSHFNRNIIQFGFDYARSFDKHSFTGLLYAQRQSNSFNGLIFPIRTQGLSFAVTYDYDQRYIVDLSAGYTGSADFEKGQRYGLFPAIGLGWVASNEAFLKDNSSINFLKARLSYGITGDINSNYRFLNEQLSSENSGWRFTNSNTWYTGRREDAIPNSDFMWEEKRSANIGLDALFFEKLSVNIDLFDERRTGILENATASVPAYTGFRLSNMNTGEVKNSGYEAVLGYNGNAGGFQYYLKGMVSFSRNEIVERSEIDQPHEWLLGKGYPMDQTRGLIFDEFYQESDFDENGLLREGVVISSFADVRPGDVKYKDQTNDGVINDYDVVPIGYSNIPEYTYGFNLGFKFKGFDFDAFFQGVTNRTVLLPTNYVMPFANDNNITAFSSNAWTPETANTATSPRLTTQANLNNYLVSDLYLYDGSFLKLRSIELGYSFAWGRIENLRVYVNGTNLFNWDKIEDFDAERMAIGYPLAKSGSLGLKVNF